MRRARAAAGDAVDFPPMTNQRIRAAVDAFVAEQAGGSTSYEARRACDFRHSPAAEAEFGPVASWPVSAVTDFSALFESCTKFDEDISGWDVANGKTFINMFAGCCKFDRPLGGWEVGRAEDLRGMFWFASAFNQDLRGWRVAASAETRLMFCGANSFDLAAHAPRAMGLVDGKPRTKWTKWD